MGIRYLKFSYADGISDISMANTSKIRSDISITILSDFFRLTRTQKDNSLRSIFAKPALSVLKALKIKTVVDVAAISHMGHTILHELTHAIKNDCTSDNNFSGKKDNAYGT